MKIFLFTLFIIMSIQSFAQDKLLKIDGTETPVKVLEIDTKLVKYKRFNNLNGPTYTISKSKVFMIQYENGTKENFNSPKTSSENDKVFNISLLPDSLRIKSYVFFNGAINIGLSDPVKIENSDRVLSHVGFSVGYSFIELGGVFYIKPRTMPRNFGFGINATLVNSSFIFGDYSYISMLPYTTNIGPHFSYRVHPQSILSLYIKPGMSYVGKTFKFSPSFSLEIGCSLSYKSFLIGISAVYIPMFYANITQSVYYYDQSNYIRYYEYTFDASHSYSYISIKIGARIVPK